MEKKIKLLPFTLIKNENFKMNVFTDVVFTCECLQWSTSGSYGNKVILEQIWFLRYKMLLNKQTYFKIGYRRNYYY